MRCQLTVFSPAHVSRLLDDVWCCSDFRYAKAHSQMEDESPSGARRRFDNPIIGKMIVRSLQGYHSPYFS
jgi:hypothetical protein